VCPIDRGGKKIPQREPKAGLYTDIVSIPVYISKLKSNVSKSVPSLPLVPEIYGVLIDFWDQLKPFRWRGAR
jgi:hypothetical protein